MRRHSEDNLKEKEKWHEEPCCSSCPFMVFIALRWRVQKHICHQYLFVGSQDQVGLSRWLKMKLLSVMSVQVWVVVDRLFSRRAEASDRGFGGWKRWMFDVAACRLDGWRVCLCWPQGFSAGRSPARSFFNPFFLGNKAQLLSYINLLFNFYQSHNGFTASCQRMYHLLSSVRFTYGFAWLLILNYSHLILMH